MIYTIRLNYNDDTKFTVSSKTHETRQEAIAAAEDALSLPRVKTVTILQEVCIVERIKPMITVKEIM